MPLRISRNVLPTVLGTSPSTSAGILRSTGTWKSLAGDWLMANGRSMAMAVLIVAYRSADKLESCIQSVERYLPDLEIHVWDNSGPAYPHVRSFAARTPHVHWYL